MEIKKNLKAIIILGLMALIPFHLYKGNGIVAHGDHYRSLDLNSYLSSTLSGWRDYENTGELEYGLETNMPFGLVYLTIGFILNPSLTQKIWIYLSMLLPMVFMYYFLKAFFKKKIDNAFLLIGAVFYSINPFYMDFPVGLNVTKYPVYLCLPLSLIFLIKFFENKEWKTKYRALLFYSLSTILLAGSFRNIAEVAPYLIINLVFFIFYLLKSTEKIKTFIVFSLGIILSLLLNFWWIFSSFLNRIYLADKFISSVASFSTQTKFYDALRLFGNWGMRAGHRDYPYYLYGEFYYSPIGLFLTFIPLILFILAIMVFIVKRKEDAYLKLKKEFYLFAFLLFLGIFLVKGASEPGGWWYRYLYDNFNFFKIFRESYAKFSLVTLFAYSLGFPLVIYNLYLLLKNKLKVNYLSSYLIFISIIFLYFVYYPFINGQIIRNYTNGVIKQSYVIVPEYWKEIENDFEELNPTERILSLPRNGIYGTSYIWESGFSGRVTELALKSTIVFDRELQPFNEGDLVVDDLYRTLEDYNINDNQDSKVTALNLIRLLNIRYLLQQNDLDWRNLNYPNKKDWSVQSSNELLNDLSSYITINKEYGFLSEDYLKRIPYITDGEKVHRTIDDADYEEYISELKDRPALSLYVLNEDYLLSKIYIPNEFVFYNGDKLDFVNKLNDESLLQLKPIFLSERVNLNEKVERDLNITLVKKISPARYKVSLSNASARDFYLAFNETFDQNWELKYNCNWIVCKNHVSAEHLKSNFYANAWHINELKSTDIYIVHEAEDRLRIGVIISICALICSICLLFLTRVKNNA